MDNVILGTVAESFMLAEANLLAKSVSYSESHSELTQTDCANGDEIGVEMYNQKFTGTLEANIPKGGSLAAFGVGMPITLANVIRFPWMGGQTPTTTTTIITSNSINYSNSDFTSVSIGFKVYPRALTQVQPTPSAS